MLKAKMRKRLLNMTICCKAGALDTPVDSLHLKGNKLLQKVEARCFVKNLILLKPYNMFFIFWYWWYLVSRKYYHISVIITTGFLYLTQFCFVEYSWK